MGFVYTDLQGLLNRTKSKLFWHNLIIVQSFFQFFTPHVTSCVTIFNNFELILNSFLFLSHVV
jgi:hypothetical protein